MRASRTILLFLAAAGVVQLLRYYPLLPERMASHFDGSGQRDGFQSKDGFVGLSFSMLVVTVILFGGLGALFRRVPSKWFNLPNRDCWLAPSAARRPSISFPSRWSGSGRPRSRSTWS